MRACENGLAFFFWCLSADAGFGDSISAIADLIVVASLSASPSPQARSLQLGLHILFLTGPHHRFKNLHIAGTATKVPGQANANVVCVRIWLALEQVYRSQNHARRTNSALCAATFNESLLHAMQLIVRRDPFDRLNRRAGHLRDWHQTTVNDPVIDHHPARPALAFAATFLGAGPTQLLAQHVEQSLHAINMQRPDRAVNG